jgi:hypothetical protein
LSPTEVPSMFPFRMKKVRGISANKPRL